MTARSPARRIAHTGRDRLHVTHPRANWWERLSTDFAARHETFDLPLPKRVLASLTAAPDVAARTLGAAAIGALALPFGFHPGRLDALLEDAHYYTEAAELGDPSLFFRAPPAGLEVQRHTPRAPYYHPRRGTCWDLTFESPYQPVNPRERQAFASMKANRTAHARYWRHDGAPRPTLVVVHGFSADPYWLNEWLFDLPQFYKMGCDVLLFTLPFHGSRKGRMAPFSGHGFFAGGVARINEAFGQAIHDLRVFLEYLLHAQGAPRVGITGLSLGGYTASLLACIEPRLAFAIPTVPLVSIPDLVLEWKPLDRVARKLMQRTERGLVDFRHLMAVSSALSYTPVIDKRRLMIVGAVGDRIAPPKHARLLWEHWDEPRLHWFAGGHLLHVKRRSYLRDIRNFLTGLAFL